jgi:hypothetical protein
MLTLPNPEGLSQPIHFNQRGLLLEAIRRRLQLKQPAQRTTNFESTETLTWQQDPRGIQPSYASSYEAKHSC